MIEFQTWLPQILGYCEFIINDDEVRQSWVERDFFNTSVTNFDELYEQIFDDLDSERFIANLDPRLKIMKNQTAALSDFFSSLHAMDSAYPSTEWRRDAKNLLNSNQWRAVRDTARAALLSFA